MFGRQEKGGAKFSFGPELAEQEGLSRRITQRRKNLGGAELNPWLGTLQEGPKQGDRFLRLDVFLSVVPSFFSIRIAAIDERMSRAPVPFFHSFSS